jgi:hypothetical protein
MFKKAYVLTHLGIQMDVNRVASIISFALSTTSTVLLFGASLPIFFQYFSFLQITEQFSLRFGKHGHKNGRLFCGKMFLKSNPNNLFPVCFISSYN